jgi:L-malate glycosyltransferase
MPMSPVRVLHVNTEQGWRGGERQTLWLSMCLARMGHVSIIAARPGEPLEKRAVEKDLQVIHTSPLGEFDLLAAFRLRAYIRKANIQIVHAHTAHAVALAAFATMGTSAAMVTTRRVDFRLRPNPASRWKYGRADAIIAISKAVAVALTESGIAPDRIEIIPSGVDLSAHSLPPPPKILLCLECPPTRRWSFRLRSLCPIRIQ